jgi:hypothetical protein
MQFHLTVAQNYIQTAPIVIPNIEQSFVSRHVPEREHHIMIDDEVQPPQAVSLRLISLEICANFFYRVRCGVIYATKSSANGLIRGNTTFSI